MKKYILLAVLLLLSAVALGSGAPATDLAGPDFLDPPVEYRPWVRWWWPGNDVDGQELRREVDVLADNYFGGAEIQAMDAALNPKAPADELARRMSWGTDVFYANVAATLEAAKARGLRMDFNLGSGWPTGGNHVKLEDGMKTLVWGERELIGPARLRVKLPPPKKPLFKYLGTVVKAAVGMAITEWHPETAKLQAVVAARVTGGHRSHNLLNLRESLRLDLNSVMVLTDKVKDGAIDFRVPAGRWVIIAFYQVDDGDLVRLCAQPGSNYVLDHFDAAGVTRNMDFLLGNRSELKPFFGGTLRAFFNDSFEFNNERHFTPDFIAEFKARRGYDPTSFLPAVTIPAADNFYLESASLVRKPAFSFGDADRRVQYDYSLTVSDLFIERFVENSSRWAEARGLSSRMQGYGLDIDVIRAMGAADIPETEQLYAGGADGFLKMASSGAHLYNRPIVTAEAMVWFGRDYASTPLKIKAAADKLFTAGVNSIIYHGFPYRKMDDYGETGWHPFSSAVGHFSSNVGEADAFFPYMKQLNLYIARCQYLLRQGKPKTDLLVYYPFLGFPGSFGISGHDEFLMNGQFADLEPVAPENLLSAGARKIIPSERSARVRWLMQTLDKLKDLEDAGYTWEWVNDHSLIEAKAVDGRIVIRGNSYKAMVLPNVEEMDQAAAENVAAMAEAGGRVIVIGDTPSRHHGYKDWAAGDAVVKAAMDHVLDSGHGSVLVVLRGIRWQQIGVIPSLRPVPSAPSFRSIARELPGGARIFFIRSIEQGPHSLGVREEYGCTVGYLLDPWTGKKSNLSRINNDYFVVDMNAFGSIFLVCGLAGNLDRPFPQGKKAFSIEKWNLSVQGPDVKGGSFSAQLDTLKDWREIEELRFSSSPGIYTASFNIDALPSESAYLYLVWVLGAAEVKVNGKFAGTALIPPFTVPLDGLLVPGRNEVEVKVVPALRNRLIGYGRKDPQYKGWKGKEDLLLPTGLLGPALVVRSGK